MGPPAGARGVKDAPPNGLGPVPQPMISTSIDGVRMPTSVPALPDVVGSLNTSVGAPERRVLAAPASASGGAVELPEVARSGHWEMTGARSVGAGAVLVPWRFCVFVRSARAMWRCFVL